MPNLFDRDDYAQRLAALLLKPNPLETGVRSGVFLYGNSKTGKSTFLIENLIPVLKAQGALVIYVDSHANESKTLNKLVREALHTAVSESISPSSCIVQLPKRDPNSSSTCFSFEPRQLLASDGITLSLAISELVTQVQTDVILILDEITQDCVSGENQSVMKALKAARDAVNLPPNSKWHFLFLGVCSQKSLVTTATLSSSQAFFCATPIDFEPLDASYVSWLYENLSADSAIRLPSFDVGLECFKRMMNRPDAFRRALLSLQNLSVNPDDILPVICKSNS